MNASPNSAAEIWRGQMTFLSPENLTTFACSAYRSVLRGRKTLDNANMWPMRLELHLSEFQPLSKWNNHLASPDTQCYVRFIARAELRRDNSHIKFISTVRKMASSRIAIEIPLHLAAGSLLLFANEMIQGPLDLIGVFVPNPLADGRSTLTQNQNLSIPVPIAQWGTSVLHASEGRKNSEKAWVGLLTVRGYSKELRIATFAERFTVPDRCPLTDLRSWPKTLACTSRAIKTIPQTDIILKDVETQWCVKLKASSDVDLNNDGNRKKMHQLCSVMVERGLAFELKIPAANGNLYLISREENSGNFYLLGVFLPVKPSQVFTMSLTECASN